MSQTVLITGASRGIGAACAELAARQGWDVVVNYQHNAQAAQQVVQAVQAHGRQAWAMQADVASEPDLLRLFADIDQRCTPLRGPINNAGWWIALSGRRDELAAPGAHDAHQRVGHHGVRARGAAPHEHTPRWPRRQHC